MSGFRLFRRKKLVPGLTLNLSRSGPSLRFGGRGAGVTVGGRRRLRATVGIPGSGVYYTKTASGGRRIRRSAAPLRSTYTGPASATSYKGCLYAVGILVLLVLTVATYGLILVPTAIGGGAWFWYRRRQPDSIAGRIIKEALVAEPANAVDLLNQALEIDPHGLKTLRACAGWFMYHQCYQDAAEAYAGILHLEADWQAERLYVACLLSAGRADEAIPRLEHMRMSPSGETVEGEVLSELATAYLIKNEPGQALAFIKLAPLQKRNLDLALQLCLYLRAVGRYLTGDRRQAITDLERVYAVNPNFPDVMISKSAMESGDFRFAAPKPYPDWYPTSNQEAAIATAPTADEQVSTVPTTAGMESTLLEHSNIPAQLVIPDQTRQVNPSDEVAKAQASASDPLVSPDGVWQWNGTRWIPNTFPKPA